VVWWWCLNVTARYRVELELGPTRTGSSWSAVCDAGLVTGIRMRRACVIILFACAIAGKNSLKRPQINLKAQSGSTPSLQSQMTHSLSLSHSNINTSLSLYQSSLFPLEISSRGKFVTRVRSMMQAVIEIRTAAIRLFVVGLRGRIVLDAGYRLRSMLLRSSCGGRDGKDVKRVPAPSDL